MESASSTLAMALEPEENSNLMESSASSGSKTSWRMNSKLSLNHSKSLASKLATISTKRVLDAQSMFSISTKETLPKKNPKFKLMQKKSSDRSFSQSSRMKSASSPSLSKREKPTHRKTRLLKPL